MKTDAQPAQPKAKPDKSKPNMPADPDKKHSQATRRKAKGAAPVIKSLPPPDRLPTGPAADPYDMTLLDVSRIQWQHGDWAALARLTLDTLSLHPERARLALIVAAAHGQLGDLTTARRFAGHALAWGCSRAVVTQVLISSAYNTLARAATCLQDAAAPAHFTTALRIVEPNSDLPLLSRSRQIRETTRLGLLPEAADLLAIDMAQIATAPADHAARLSLLDGHLTQIRDELSRSLGRGDLFASPPGLTGQTAPELPSAGSTPQSTASPGPDDRPA